ncbi:hypothetical protein BH09ACT7_BH09ACT7_33690 [soil metagenome]
MRGGEVVGSDGVTWSVWRRWLPWRRALGLREVWYSSTSDTADQNATSENESPPDPKNPVAKAALLVLGAVLWLVITGGKAVLIALAVVLVVVASTLDLILQLLVLPFVLLARLGGLARWPVQVERAHLHVRTEHARGYAAAGALRDELAAQIRTGSPALRPS